MQKNQASQLSGVQINPVDVYGGPPNSNGINGVDLLFHVLDKRFWESRDEIKRELAGCQLGLVSRRWLTALG